MYNEERKHKFIATYTKSINTSKIACIVFEAIAPYEETHEKDMCSMTIEELQPVVNNILGLRASSKWMGITIMREYVRWCVANKLPGSCNSIMEVDLLGIDKIKVQMVASPLHLQKYLNEVFDSEDEETIDNIYRCFFWMSYSGMAEEYAISVESENVNLPKLYISHDEKEWPIYKEAVPAFQNAINLTHFAYKHPNYLELIFRERVVGTNIMRGIKANIKILTIRSTLSRKITDAHKRGKSSQQLSYNRIWLSGLFYRMYELERAGIPPNFSEIAIAEMCGKTYSLKGSGTLRQKQNRKARDYEEDYQRWKLTFSV